jgi:hypothetical protein
VFSFDYGLVTLTLAMSIFVSGWAADHVGPRAVMYGLAAVSIIYALVWTILTRRIRRSAEG